MTATVLIWLGFMGFTLAVAKRRLPAIIYAVLWVSCAAWSFWYGFNF